MKTNMASKNHNGPRKIWKIPREEVVNFFVVLGVCMGLTTCVIVVVYFFLYSIGVARASNVSLEVIGQVASIVIGTASLVMATRLQGFREIDAEERQSNREVKVAQREIYQRLELASIELFRFEADHPDLVRLLYDTDASGNPLPVPTVKADKQIYFNYVCQTLNLHEMAVRFQIDGVMPKGVFNSWIAWFWNLSNAAGFPNAWEDEEDGLRDDYMEELQRIYNFGLEIVRGPGTDEEKKSKIFKQVREWFPDQETT